MDGLGFSKGLGVFFAGSLYVDAFSVFFGWVRYDG